MSARAILDARTASYIMNAPFSPPPVDLLTQAIKQVRPMLATGTTKERVHVLWAAAKTARDLGTSDVVADDFIKLAVEINLIDRHGRWTGADVRKDIRRHGAEDARHVIAWALRGMNPFEEGPLKKAFQPGRIPARGARGCRARQQAEARAQGEA